jgi:uncharacterized protein YegL
VKSSVGAGGAQYDELNRISASVVLEHGNDTIKCSQLIMFISNTLALSSSFCFFDLNTLSSSWPV